MKVNSWWRQLWEDRTKPLEGGGGVSLPVLGSPLTAEAKAYYAAQTKAATTQLLSNSKAWNIGYSASSFGGPTSGAYSDSQIEAIKQAFNEPIEVEVKRGMSKNYPLPVSDPLNQRDREDDTVTLIFGTGERASYTRGKWRGKDTELIKRISEKTGRAAIYPDKQPIKDLGTVEWSPMPAWQQSAKDFQVWSTNITNLPAQRTLNDMSIEELEKLIKDRRAKMKKPAKVEFGIGK